MNESFWREMKRRVQTWRKERARTKRYAETSLLLPTHDFKQRLKEIDTVLDKEFPMPAVHEAYCMRCRAMKPIDNVQGAQMGKGGRPAIKGTCSSCGTKASRILRSGEQLDS